MVHNLHYGKMVKTAQRTVSLLCLKDILMLYFFYSLNMQRPHDRNTTLFFPHLSCILQTTSGDFSFPPALKNANFSLMSKSRPIFYRNVEGIQS